MAYFLDNNNPDIVVALYRQSQRIPEQYDRVVWSKTEQRFIYGDSEEYTVYVGEEEIPEVDTSIKHQELVKKCYRLGLTQCDSSFYDDGKGRLYEIYDTSKDHVLIFDANTLTDQRGNTNEK